MELPAGELAKRLGIDGQRLKRLRENQGDTAYLKWLRYEKKAGIILPEHVIRWFCQEKISGEDVEFISDRMSMVQIYHYVHRQMEENQRKSKDILSTWSDYLNMARRLNMDTGDAIIYRVSRLYQRHKELVERCQQMELSLQAAEILREYPHIEEIYRFIRGIYHYEDKKYMVLVPEKVEEIMTEGNTLHHCVNKTEKYWERIERQESYIFFLRKTEAPDKAYYTLEVEPDGTVRQKRTMYDRQEADIEDATKFLKKWQKEISKRITDRERALAKTSRMLRKEEFAELKKQQTIIYTGHLGGQLLVDILMRDLIENEDTFAAEAEEKAVAEAA